MKKPDRDKYFDDESYIFSLEEYTNQLEEYLDRTNEARVRYKERSRKRGCLIQILQRRLQAAKPLLEDDVLKRAIEERRSQMKRPDINDYPEALPYAAALEKYADQLEEYANHLEADVTTANDKALLAKDEFAEWKENVFDDELTFSDGHGNEILLDDVCEDDDDNSPESEGGLTLTGAGDPFNEVLDSLMGQDSDNEDPSLLDPPDHLFVDDDDVIGLDSRGVIVFGAAVDDESKLMLSSDAVDEEEPISETRRAVMNYILDGINERFVELREIIDDEST